MNQRQVRHPSVASHRYHSDPLKNLPTHPEEGLQLDSDYPVSTDADNYLIPDRNLPPGGFAPSASGVVYTPVVTGQQGKHWWPLYTYSVEPNLSCQSIAPNVKIVLNLHIIILKQMSVFRI